MKRDIVIGLAASLTLHGVVWVIGRVPNAAPAKLLAAVEIPSGFVMRPLEPEEPKPEPIDNKDEPQPQPDFAPSQPELLRPPNPKEFVQLPEPPQPEGPHAVAITIPPGRALMDGKDRGEIFDPARLDQQPDPRYQAKPIYPFDLRRSGITGQVVVGFVVDAAGSVQGAYAVSSTQREFESAAVQAVTKWKFKPGRKGGHAVSTRMQVPIVFSITADPE